MPIEEDEVASILEIKLHKIKGSCPVYKKDDRIIIDGPERSFSIRQTLLGHAFRHGWFDFTHSD